MLCIKNGEYNTKKKTQKYNKKKGKQLFKVNFSETIPSLH